MYTREDIGTTVYLPGITAPILIAGTVNEGDSYSDEFEVVITRNEYPRAIFMDTEGYQISKDGERLTDDPVFSRNPYTPGEPFVCVTERPEPEHYTPQHNEPFIAKVNGTYTIATLKSSPPLDGEWHVKTIEGAKVGVPVADVHPFSEAPQRIGMCASNYALFIALERMGVMPPEAYLDDVPFPTAAREHHSPADAEPAKERPFGPEDNKKPVYDQDGNEWHLYELALRPNEFIAYLVGCDETTVMVNPDGTTATALKFTRTKPAE